MEVTLWRQLGEPDDEIRRCILRAARDAFADPGPWRVRGAVSETEDSGIERFMGSSFLDENYRSLLRHCGVDRPDPPMCESWMAVVQGTLDEVLAQSGRIPAADGRAGPFARIG